ncbi:ABC transporter permease [Streptococcus ovis]|uniref:ABC transporter permease n=1 Tax=Streptococcus ovis TaxID=82806 RepID=UPI00037D918C|nr:ABC transporter permease subunit [Streptococcus ovis]
MLTFYEMKKVLSKRVTQIAILIAIGLAFVFSLFAIGSFQYEDTDNHLIKGISAPRMLVETKNQWRGELSPDRIVELIQAKQNGDWQSTSDILFALNEMLVGEAKDNESYDYEAILTADSESLQSFYDYYKENLKKEVEEVGKTPEQRRFLMKEYKKIRSPFYYEAADAWDTMLLYATTFSLVLIMIISLITAGIFSDEFRYHTSAILFSTKYGRSKVIKSKIYAGLAITTFVYVIGMGLLSFICFSVMGISGILTAYQFYQPYSIYSLTFGELYGVILICGYIASLLSASLSMFVAAKTRMTSIAIVAPFILFFVSPFIGRVLPFKSFFSLTPDQLTNIMNSVRIPYIYQIGSVVFKQIPFLVLFYTLLSIAILPFLYYSFRQTKVE